MSPRGQQKTSPAAEPRKVGRSVWQRILRGLALCIDLIVVFALLLTGYAGCISPLSHNSWWGVLPLAFPICFWVTVVLMLLQLLWHRRGAVVLALGMLCCGGPVLTYFPLHVTTPKAPAGAEEFSLLTYNTLHSHYADNDDMTIADYILSQNADIVCTQEAAALAPSQRDAAVQQRVDSLRSRYPYIIFGGGSGMQGIMSKYPVENIHLDAAKGTFGSGDVAAYRITLPSGRRICVFNVHLYSFGLSSTPLREATENKEESKLVLDKLRIAAEGRARQVNKLIQWLRLYGGPDVIICGDFNDVPGCHTIRTLADVGFKSVYPSIGFAPMTTYNKRHLYFCIDHVLYRGDLQPLKLKKGTLKTSDHYSLKVTFALETV